MTGTQTLIAILAIATAITATSIARAWIADRTHSRQIDHQRRQLDEETRRFQLLADIVSKRLSNSL